MVLENDVILRTVTLEIKGGLGNQMFQYAAGRAFSLEIGAKLFLEKKLGFTLDREYRRIFELDRLPVTFSTSRFQRSFPFYLERFHSLLSKKFLGGQVSQNSWNYLFERNFEFVDLSKVDLSKKNYWLSGYFQDPRYFETHKNRILSELTPPPPLEKKYLDLANLSKNYNLIALGIRMYEESSTPDAHSRFGFRKSIDDYRIQLSKVLSIVSNPLVLVFTTQEFDFLKSLGLPRETIFVNRDTGFNNSLDKLWLLSNCQHHIFNNSTFYWWGAALSKNLFSDVSQQIYCADNFLNPNIAYPDWKTF
jgi:hypothetical protein